MNSIVFQPPKRRAPISSFMQAEWKRHMNYAIKPSTGERVYYIHTKPFRRTSFTEDPPMVILYSHGNAEDLLGCSNYVMWLSQALGIAIVAYDYCGYGDSGHTLDSGTSAPSESGVYGDALTMYAEVQRIGYLPNRTIIMGRSVGGGPACYLAQKYHHEIGGLLLQSTFTSCLRVVSTCCLPVFFSWADMFNNAKRVKKALDCPILLIHGTHDEVVPFRCAESLLKTVESSRRKIWKKLSEKEPRATLLLCHSPGDQGHTEAEITSQHQRNSAFYHWVEGGGHNDLEKRSTERYVDVVHQYLVYLSKLSAQ